MPETNTTCTAAELTMLLSLLESISCSGYQVTHYRGDTYGDPQYADKLETCIAMLSTKLGGLTLREDNYARDR